jgi:hypothetical protein
MSEPPPDSDIPPQRLARLLLGGAVGHTLLNELLAHFPTISRGDVFMGIALAWTDREAALLAAEAELAALKVQMRRPRKAA